MADERSAHPLSPTQPMPATLCARAVPVLAAVLLLAPAAAVGQSLPSAWPLQWSPLAAVPATLVSFPTSDLATSSPLTDPAPRLGMFWTGRNPAGLAGGTGDSWANFDGSAQGESGAFRRPLDPGDTHDASLAALAWEPVGAHAGVAADVAVDRTTLGAPIYADVADPYTLSPLAVLDTSGLAMGRTTARIEGAGGLAVGRLLLGASLGYRAQQIRTVRSPVPHQDRVANPALVLGAGLRLLRNLRVGAYGRWQETRESINLFSIAAASRVYQFTGYDDPGPQDIAGTWYSRYRESSARGGGLTADGSLGRLRWTAYGDVGSATDAGWSQQTEHPKQDRWNADVRAGGVALQRAFRGDEVLVTAHVDWSHADGRVHRIDLPGVTYTNTATVVLPGIDVRLRPPTPWRFDFTLSDPWQERQAADSVVQRRSVLRSWTPTLTAAASRTLGGGVALGLSLGLAHVAVGGAIPDPAYMGPTYDAYIAPTTQLYTTPVTAQAAGLTLRWDHGRARSFYVQAEERRASAGGSSVTLPDSPTGSRTTWALRFGALLHPGDGASPGR
jgi:hypothetical protein